MKDDSFFPDGGGVLGNSGSETSSIPCKVAFSSVPRFLTGEIGACLSVNSSCRTVYCRTERSETEELFKLLGSLIILIFESLSLTGTASRSD